MVSKYINKLFNKSIVTGDKLKSTKKIIIGQYQLLANKDHQLDAHLSHFPSYSQNFPRIAFEILKNNPDDTIIDIGANIGDTIALLRKYEGDEVYFSFLEQNAEQFADVTLLKYYLSDIAANKSYYVEKKEGTARIVETENSSINSDVITLDKLSETTDLGKVRLVKIDTDGFDCKIIRGSIDLLKKYCPVLFFEYHYDLSIQQNEIPLDTLILLKNIDYNNIIYFDNYGKLICSTTLYDTTQLVILDKYIQNGNGTFPYYDVLIFHKNDVSLFEEIISKEIKLSGITY